jgi:hypothetical protein
MPAVEFRSSPNRAQVAVIELDQVKGTEEHLSSAAHAALNFVDLFEQARLRHISEVINKQSAQINGSMTSHDGRKFRVSCRPADHTESQLILTTGYAPARGRANSMTACLPRLDMYTLDNPKDTSIPACFCTRPTAWALCNPFMFACLAALCVAMVFHSLTQYINQDEEVFITAAYLAQHMRLYADFLYLQSPIYPLVLSKLLILFSSVSPFLIARLLSAILAIGSVLTFFGLAARLSKNPQFAFILTSLFASAPLMLLAYGSARNDIMPIFFGLCGVWLALRGLDAERKQSSSYVALFFAGFCMALAVGAKVTATFIPLSAMLYILLRSRLRLLPLILGGAVGSLPIVYYAATTFDNFLYCNATFHLTIFREFFIENGVAEALALPFRVKSMLAIWAGEPALVVAASFLAFVAFASWRRGRLVPIVEKHFLADNRTFIILLMVTAIPFVFLTNVTDKQYLQPAIPYVLLSCAALFPLAQGIMERRQVLLFAAMAVVILALQGGRFVVEAVGHLKRSLWTPTEVHNLSALIALHVKHGAVATLYPALALDAGSSIYPQFATSIFFYRSGDHLAPERVLELNGISPRTLSFVFSLEPPAAVFIGNTRFDPPLLNWAQRNCYREVDLSPWEGGVYEPDGWKPRLFVRPEEPESCRRG